MMKQHARSTRASWPKSTKWAAWTAGVLALAALAAVLAAHVLFDRDGLKALVIERVKAAYSRDLAIADLSLHLRPFPALHATGIALSNPSWASEPYLLRAESLTARLELLPLIGGKVVLKSLSASGVIAHLETAADGRRSWVPEAGAAGAGAPPAFDPKLITSVALRDAQVFLHSGKEETDIWKVEEFHARAQRGWRNVRLDAKAVRREQPVTVHAEFDDLAQAGTRGAVSEGSADLRWDKARMKLSGRLPLDAGLRNIAARAELDADSLTGMLAFFGKQVGNTAPFKGSADLREAEGGIALANLKFTLGKLAMTGEASIRKPGSRLALDARLATGRLDWAQFIADIGRPPPRPKPAGELFSPNPLLWPLLAAMEGTDAHFDLQVASLKLRSGTETQNLKARIAVKDARANVEPFSFGVFGGAVKGAMQLDAKRKSVRLVAAADNVMLGAWLDQKGKKGLLSGGPMKIDAEVGMAGGSMKELAASLTGPVSVRIGAAKVFSKKLQDAESLLVGLAPVFSAKNAEHVDLACISARLPFAAGRAAAERIAGARSEASQLLTSGHIDLRQQTLDLRGRVRARSGVSLGMTNLAGDVRIAGRLLQPEVGLDPVGAPEAMARVGAAVLTAGVSLLATAVWDAAVPDSDACNAVFKGQPSPAGKPAAAKRKAKPRK